MNILDENPENQAALLTSWRIHYKQIGVNVGNAGMTDESIIPLLLKHRFPTFFTRDKGFYDRRLCHSRYCLVVLDVGKNESASFIRRFLRHPALDSITKRAGRVIRVSRGRIRLRNVADRQRETELRWFKVA